MLSRIAQAIGATASADIVFSLAAILTGLGLIAYAEVMWRGLQ